VLLLFIAIAVYGQSVLSSGGGEGSSGGGNGVVCFKPGFENLAADVRSIHYVPREEKYLNAIESIRIIDLQMAMYPEQTTQPQPSFMREASDTTVLPTALPLLPMKDGATTYNYFRKVVARLSRSHTKIADYLNEALVDALVPNAQDKGKLEIHFTRNYIEYVQNVGWIDIQGLTEEQNRRCAVVTIAYHHPIDKNGKTFRIVFDEVLYFHPAHLVQSRSATLAHEFMYLKDHRAGKTAENAIKFVSDVFRDQPQRQVGDLLAYAEGFDQNSTYAHKFLGELSTYMYGDFFKLIEGDWKVAVEVLGRDLGDSWSDDSRLRRVFIQATMGDHYGKDSEWSIGIYELEKQFEFPDTDHARWERQKLDGFLAEWPKTVDRLTLAVKASVDKIPANEKKLKEAEAQNERKRESDDRKGYDYNWWDKQRNIEEGYRAARYLYERLQSHQKDLAQLPEAIRHSDEILNSAYEKYFAARVDSSEFSPEMKEKMKQLIEKQLAEFRLTHASVEAPRSWGGRYDLSGDVLQRHRDEFMGYPIPRCDSAKDCDIYEVPKGIEPSLWIFKQ